MPTAPYDTLEPVLQAARVRLNDAIQSIGGDILTDVAVFTPQVVNNAWRRLQEYLADRGFAALNRETVLSTVPACTATDQGTRVSFNWVTYFDGTNPQAAPVLPQDMIAPLELSERVSGGTGNFTPIDQVFNGLPTAPRSALNRLWEWRQETIYMPGATGTTDILMRYAGYLADFLIGPQTTLAAPGMTNVTTTMPLTSGATIPTGSYVQLENEIVLVSAAGGTNSQTVSRAQFGTTAAAHAAGVSVIVLPNGIAVPIMRSLNSFAWFVCSEAARPRGDLDAGWFDQQAMLSIEYIWNRDYRQGRSLYKQSELGKMPDQDSATLGPTGPRGRGGNQ